MTLRRRTAVLGPFAALGAAMGAGLHRPALAQAAFPDRPIRFIVPFGAGGSMDAVSRAVAGEASKTLGQTVIVENRPGAGGSNGPATVASSKPDGTTLMVAAPTQVPVALALKTKTPYDAARDFMPVTRLAEETLIVMTSRAIPARTLADFVAHLRAHPDTVNYSSAGIGSLGHLAGELFKVRTGVSMQHVPYRGGAAGTLALLNGEVGMSLTTAGSGSAYLDRINVLAAMGTRRVPILPDVPTAAEAGVADLVVNSWAGVFAPAGTPQAIVETLDAAFRTALASPAVIEPLTRLGIATVGEGPEAFARTLERDLRQWTEVVAQARITLD